MNNKTIGNYWIAHIIVKIYKVEMIYYRLMHTYSCMPGAKISTLVSKCKTNTACKTH